MYEHLNANLTLLSSLLKNTSGNRLAAFLIMLQKKILHTQSIILLKLLPLRMFPLSILGEITFRFRF